MFAYLFFYLVTGRKFAYRHVKENFLVGTTQSCSFSNPKGDVFECSGNNIKLSECKRDISRHVQTYGLGINRVKKSATKWILFFAVQVNKCHISRANCSRIVNYN